MDAASALPPLDATDGYDRFFRDDGRAGVWQPRGQGRGAPVAALPAGRSELAVPSQPGAAQGPPPRLYGLITIYTLIDERVDEFDRLVERAAGEVRAQEPDTLVYIVHVVPKAPLQRIFYEIYRDRSAFEHHERQPYIERFVAERRPCVLATNVIELRLRHAKVSPLPALSPDAYGRRPGVG
jgi:quinol monooxygenase YgiN